MLNKKFYQLFWFSLFFKIILSYFLPLVADEAYYWVWSKNLQLSYFDHPGMVAWLTYIGSPLESFGHLVRLPMILIGHAGLWFWTKSFEAELGESSFEFLLLLLLCPLTGIGGMLMLPDVPLIFFSGLSVFLFRKTLASGSLRDYILFGASLGLGFCSKYHIVFLGAGLIFYLILSKQLNKIRFLYLIAAFIAFFLAASPVFIWNAENDWASFRFQIHHGLGESKFEWRYPVEYFLGQMMIVFPTLFFFFFKQSNRRSLAFSIAIVPLLFFLYSSLKNSVEPNWTVAAIPAIFVVILSADIKVWQLRAQNYFYGVLLTFVLSSILFGFANKIHTKLAEPLLTLQLRDFPTKYAPLYTINYQLASQIWYASKIRTLKIKSGSRYDLFETFPDNKPSGDFYLLKYDWSGLPDWLTKENYHIEQVLDLHNELKLVHCMK